MTPFELFEEIDNLVEEFIKDCVPLTSSDVHVIDAQRSFYSGWTDEDRTVLIIPAGARSTLDYYGGFEYVDKSCVREIGNYVFYEAKAGRVAEALGVAHDDDNEEED
jgi:hypothetical protein